MPNPQIKFEKSNASLQETLDDLLDSAGDAVPGRRTLGLSIGVFPASEKDAEDL